MTTTDADSRLAEWLAALVRDESPKPQCRRWLLTAVLAIARGETASLDSALGLRRGNGQSAQLSRRLRMAARDAHLSEAIDAVALDHAVSQWERCRRLSAEVSRFDRAWPALRCLPAPSNDWPTVRRCLWSAAIIGLPLPTTARGLHDAWKRSRDCSLHRETGKVLAYASNLDNWVD